MRSRSSDSYAFTLARPVLKDTICMCIYFYGATGEPAGIGREWTPPHSTIVHLAYNNQATMSGRKSIARTTPAVNRSISSTNPVEQLSALRDFVGEGSGYTETDLVNCLKQCGYNVSRAGEILMTGQFKRPKSAPGSKPKGKSAFFKVMAKSPPRASGSAEYKSSLSSKKRTEIDISSKRPSVSLSPNIDCATQSRGAVAKVLDLTLNETSNDNASDARLLLCRRWLSDAVITCRKGRVSHKERLLLRHSLTGYGIVRFTAACAEGRLPENVAALLTPLLRAEPPLIQVEAESLMQDDSLVMGSSLPVQVTIYLTSPKSFFECMQPDSAADASTESSQYFANKENSKKGNKRHSKHISVADAAFLLLQWAEYGDVPDFAVTGESEDGKGETKPSPIKDSNDVSLDEADLELNDEEYEEASLNGSTAEGKELDSFVGNAADKWTALLPEADDPTGFAHHVTLRPYQKQAMYFMLQREKVGESREQVEEQMQLLQELSSANPHNTTRKVNGSGARPGQGIACECGPVQVSEAVQRESTTLNGELNPVSHPLWQSRYLASPDCSRSFLFYVNELLGVATHVPPHPPKPCSGGILADAMGLGKTVMLLALILQSKNDANSGQTSTPAVANAKSHGSVPSQSPGTTLVVAKLSLLAQWEEEIRSKTNLTCKIYYGKQLTIKEIEDVVSFLFA
jgi:SNF2-related domain